MLYVETSAFGATTSAIARRSFDATISVLDAEMLALDAEMPALSCAATSVRSHGVTGDCAELPAILAQSFR